LKNGCVFSSANLIRSLGFRASHREKKSCFPAERRCRLFSFFVDFCDSIICQFHMPILSEYYVFRFQIPIDNLLRFFKCYGPWIISP
jgi:hypothetical protein